MSRLVCLLLGHDWDAACTFERFDRTRFLVRRCRRCHREDLV